MSWIGEDRFGNAVLRVRIVPRAARDEPEGVVGDALKIRLRAPPVEGRANAALVRWLADRMGIAVGRVCLRSGERSRLKLVSLTGCRAVEVVRRLGLPP